MAIVTAFSFFLVFFLFQAALARFLKPKSEDKFIIFLYVILPAAVFAGSWMFRFFNLLSTRDAVLSYMLFFVVASSWVASYPAIYAVCPTLIMSWVIESNAAGTKLDALQELLALKKNSTERIDDAVHDRLIRSNGTTVELTLAGRLVHVFFALYRRILGLNSEAI